MSETGKYRAGDLVIDMTKRCAIRDGEEISLSDLSWRVLSVLIKHAPETVGYEELAAGAWPQQQVSPDTMSQRIKLLRRSLDDDPKTPRYVATERGVGYRFVAEVEPITESAPSNQKRIVLAVAATLAAMALLFLWKPNREAVLVPQSPDITAAVSTADLIASGYQYLGRGSYEDNERALSLFEQAQEKDPNNVAAMIGQSFAHSHRETKYDFDRASSEKAKELARQALDLDPSNGRAWHALGFALDAQGDTEGALRAYEQAIAIDPEHAVTYYNWGNVLFNLKRNVDAIAQYQKATEIAPEFAIAYNNWGNALSMLRRHEEARIQFQKAVDINSELTSAYSGLGNALSDLGRYEEAIAQFKKAVEIDPEFIIAYNDWGNTLNFLKRHEEAITKFQKAVEINPKFIIGYYNWSLTLRKLGRDKAADAKLQKAKELEQAQSGNSDSSNLIDAHTIFIIKSKISQAYQNNK